ncbi:MAG: amino acid adenylation domain-containing protein, partial [Candidatus Aminicenantes bacterium]
MRHAPCAILSPPGRRRQVILTYRQLNEESNQLASFLRKKGVTRGSVVVLMFRSSVEMVLGALAVLKAGGAYLVLWPGLAGETVNSILAQSSALLVLTGSSEIGSHSLALLRDRGLRPFKPFFTEPRQQISDFDHLPIPDRSLVNYENYTRDIGLAMVKNTITLQGSRGCPYQCLYCHKIWPRRHVTRSAENIFKEVELYYNMGMRRFVFVDDIFNLDLHNRLRFFEQVIKNKLKVNFFFPNGLRCDLLTRDYIDLMVKAGTVSLGLALETASPRLQRLIKKNLDLDKLRENILYICEKHPQVILELFLMHGFPTETEEEALMTLDFLKHLKWVDFPYLHILKIYPNSEMAELAVEKGISAEAIARSANLAFHELPDTLPFDKSFTLKFQADFLNDYFLVKDRLLARLPYQMRVLTPDEIAAKYNSYLPTKIETFAQLLEFVGISADEPGIRGAASDKTVPGLHAKMQAHFPQVQPVKQALRILLLDLSQFFSNEREILYDGVEPPLGLMYLLTYLNRELAGRVNGKIAKSRIDFDSFDELKALLDEFQPQVIGIRTLTYYADFFHKTAAMIRHWGIHVPIIAGGPYATSDYAAILQDPHVDLVVLSEGELTFTHLIRKILENQGKLPGESILKEIPGIAFIPGKEKESRESYPEVLMLDALDQALSRESLENLEPVNRPGDLANILYRDRESGYEKILLDHSSAHALCSGSDNRQPAAAFVFDGAVHQVFPALGQGGALCISPIEKGLTSAGLELLEFYKAPRTDTLSGPSINIRIKLAENNPWVQKTGSFENEIEEKLALVWAEVLGIEKSNIKRDDNFFEKGGHSLRATVLAAKIHKTFNVDIPLKEIFSTPDIQGLARRIKEAVEEKFISIKPGEKKEFYELSSVQKRLYVIQQMDETGISYNLPSVWIFQGEVDKTRLEQIFKQLITRHESLRTSFKTKGTRPVQWIHDKVEFEIEYYLATENTEGIRGLAPLSKEPVTALISSFVRPFDLSQAPLLRVGLIKTSVNQYILLVDMHHIISDGRSAEILIREFAALYEKKELPGLRLQYKDYSLWLHRVKNRESLVRQQEYWLKEFAAQGEIPKLNLPTDYVRPAVQGFEGFTTNFVLGFEETAALKNLGFTAGATLFMVVLAVINLFLSKLTNQEDIVVGTPVAGRRHADLEPIIGMFVNTLALRNFPKGEKTFTGFLTQVKENALMAFENQEYQYEDLVDAVNVDRDTSRNALFDVVFALEGAEFDHISQLQLPGLKINNSEFETNISKFDLTLFANQSKGELLFRWEYSTKLFKPTTIERFINYFKNLISVILANPGKKISQIEMLSPGEKSQILYDFNDTKAAYSRNKTMHQLFEEQAERTPDHMALVGNCQLSIVNCQLSMEGESCGQVLNACGERGGLPADYVSITYRELNEKANQLAGVLRKKRLDTSDNRLVALLMDRSIEMMVSVMGILKAGGGYIPLDPYLPETRIVFILSSLNVRYVLTNHLQLQRLGNVFQKLPGLEPIVCVEEGVKEIAANNRENPLPLAKAEDIAYVIFTSGSTGVPKGVAVQHRPVINIIQWVNKTFTVGAPDKLLFVTSLGFDLSVYDIFGILASGASIRLAAHHDIKNPVRLLEIILREGITIWDSAPAALQQLVPFFRETRKYKNTSGLRLVLLSGDWVPVTLPDILTATFKRGRVIALGGATEATIWSNYYPVTRVGPGWTSIPYGKPVQNAAYYILNSYGKVCPLGVPGDLYIGGECLASGYINEPALTREKFVHNPFIPGTRMYKTGDIARWFDDGNMEFLGRSDNQVKIRGYRIELGEIETQLLNHKEVKEAVVMAVGAAGTAASDQRLVAYVVPGSMPGVKDLSDQLTRNIRNFLKEKLPEYMIPQAFVLMEQFPLTPNGKVHRKALPEPVMDTGCNYLAPRNEIEEKLVEIWSEVLGIHSSIGINDNFFQLGGHSLNATTVISRIHHVFNVKMPLAEIFRIPSVRELSEYIQSAAREKYVTIQPGEDREYYPLSSAQKRLYFLYRMDTRNIGYNMPAIMVLEGDIDQQKFAGTFKRLIMIHESLRTSFHMIENEPVQEIHDEVEFQVENYELEESFGQVFDASGESSAHELHELHEKNENEKGTGGLAPLSGESAASTINNFIRPFDLSRAPLLRVGLAKTGPGQHILLVDMHHIVSDGISTGLLLNGFITLINGGFLPEPGVTYKDYAQWQISQMETEALKKQEAFWLREFAEEIPVLNLPMDFPRPFVQNLEGNTLMFEIGAAETKQLQQLLLEEECSLFMGLLSLFNVLLSRLSSQEDIVVGCVAAGRLLPGLEEVIGMFVNTLPLRNCPAGNKPFGQFLQEVKDKTLRAFENQEYQFEELVEKLSVKRDIGRNPLFDTALDVQDPDINININIQDVPIQGLKMKPYPYSSRISKFDLIFHCEDLKDKLLFTVEYSVKLFKKDTISRFAAYFKKIVSQVIDNRDMMMGEIDILAEAEKQEILNDLNGNVGNVDSSQTYPGRLLHQLFEEQVTRTPDYIAVSGALQLHQEGTRGLAPLSKLMSITYKELNKKANQLAHLLRKKGVKPDNIVGIMMEPGLEMITAALALLKAGGVYLPIDPTYPLERIQFMLDDCEAKFLLTTSGPVENFPFTALQGLQINEHKHKHGRGRGYYITPGRSQITDLDAQPLVDRTTVNYDKYSQYIGIAMVKQTISIQATRGCPYHCAYCHKIWPKKHVFRSAEHIFAEVQQYYQLGVRRFVFIDDVFNLNRENSQRFFQLIIDNTPDVQLFFPNGVRGDILTRDYIDLMVQAGTTSIALALETASPRLQKLVGKNLNLEKLEENLEYLCKRYPGVILELFTMHGFPSETEEEALQTLDFIKRLQWLHFPYVHILKIYPSTDMAEIARKSGISSDTIARSTNLAYHELPETLPFDKHFTIKYQADFLNRYFLLKERLLHVLPYQMKILTEDELVQKYNSYLPVEIKTFTDFLEFASIKPGELDLTGLSNKNPMHIPSLDRRIKESFASSAVVPPVDALKILLLDLSLFFSKDTETMLYNLVEPPLGLMYLLTNLKQQFGSKINGKIAKSCIDFDNYQELKQLLEEFQPDVIGLRTLTFYKHFFHRTAAMIRDWGIDVPVIAGGPYATSDYASLLNDHHIDLVVLGEGELTFCEIIAKILENNGKLPDETVLQQIAGIVYIPRKNGSMISNTRAREIIMPDALMSMLAKESTGNLSNTNQPGDTAYVIYTSGTTGKPKGVMVEHRNITGLMTTGKDLLDYNSGDVWTMFHSFCFDFSVWEMYGALLYGGKLVLIPRMIARDPQQYLEILKQERVTILNQTPTVFYQLVQEEMQDPGKDLHLRYIIFGGEALKPGKLKPWKEKYPETELINMYGITETTVHVT